jgi:fructose-1-phosphate kinase PfkB-like protein
MRDGDCIARIKQGKSVSWHIAEFDQSEAVSQLGFTDCFVAGALHATFAERPLNERFTMAFGAALANQRVLGAGLFEKGDAIRFQRDIRVREIAPVEVDVEI